MGSSNSKLGLFDSVHLLVGGMIGSAIFSLSGITILQAGPASLLSWLLGGLILLAYGLQTARHSSWERHGSRAGSGVGSQHGPTSSAALPGLPFQPSILAFIWG